MKKQPKSGVFTIKASGDWASLLADAIREDGDRHPGKDWKTFEELRSDFPGIGKDRLYQYLSKKMESGQVESVERHLLRNDGRRKVRRVFYRVVKGK